MDKQLAAELANQQSTLAANQEALTQAQTAYDHLAEGLNTNLHPGIVGAQASLNAAEQGYQQARQAVESAREGAAKQSDEQIRAAEQQLEAARADAEIASRNVMRSVFGGLLPGDATAGVGLELLNQEEAEQLEHDAQRRLNEAEQQYQRALRENGQPQVAEAQLAEAAAFQNRVDAQVGLDAAHLGARHEMESAGQAVGAAQRNAQAASDAGATAIANIRVDQNATTLVSPMEGVVTGVHASVGEPAGGKMFSIADDARLMLEVSVRERDIADIEPGQRVTFTTATTGNEEFTGRVHEVGLVANSADAADAEQAPTVEFPVHIIVDGHPKLRIGATAKAEIIVEEQRDCHRSAPGGNTYRR